MMSEALDQTLFIASYLIGILVAAFITTVSMVIVLSHKPREPLPSELKYRTNDGSKVLHPLPPRIKPNTARTTSEIELSVVIPCYNEVERLGKMLNECVEYLEEMYPLKYEILVVDDCSTDGTGDYALKEASRFGLKPHVLRVIYLKHNRGKGGAVTHGMLHTRGKFALFADADGASRFRDMNLLFQSLKDCDEGVSGVAIGSRSHMVNTDAVVKRSFVRNFLMYGLHTLVYVFGIHGVQDTQCGFKMFNYEATLSIFPHVHTERWIFDVEVLLLAELQNINVEELSINWQEVDGSKVNLAKDSIDMAKDLVVTRLAYLLGVYKIDECGRRRKKT